VSGNPSVSAIEAVDRIVEGGGDADDVLRAVLDALHERGVAHASIRFLENGKLVDGPSVGPAGGSAVVIPVVYEGRTVGELVLADGDAALAETVAARIAPYVLVGWDTSGEPWDA
jgi:hypothetical protein